MDNLLKLKEARKNSPSGRLIFYHCEQMNYEKVMKLFTTMRAMMSAECGLPAQQGTRNRRNTDLLLPLLLGGAYDPTSIWYQYFLCKDIDLYCYFFTQGWTQGQYGQYYLYDNLLDDTTGLFAGATDSNLATLALLGGLGGGVGGYGQPAPYYGGYAQPAPSPQSRKRRAASKPGCDVACVPCTDGEAGCVNDKKCTEVCRNGKGFEWISSWISSFFGGSDEDEDDEDDDDDDDKDEDEEDEDEDEDDEDEDEEEDEDEDEDDEDE